MEWKPADIEEVIAFINNRQSEVTPGEYEYFMYEETLEYLHRLKGLLD